MTKRTARTARLETRMTADQKALIERAAAYRGRTVSDFVFQTLHDAAHAVIQEHEVLRLTRSQSRMLVEALLNAPPPNKALRQAARRYRRDVVSQ